MISPWFSLWFWGTQRDVVSQALPTELRRGNSTTPLARLSSSPGPGAAPIDGENAGNLINRDLIQMDMIGW